VRFYCHGDGSGGSIQTELAVVKAHEHSVYKAGEIDENKFTIIGRTSYPIVKCKTVKESIRISFLSVSISFKND
jgi:hypothetical protein